jgi:NADH:ubiquinone oxidoreductase subunit 5 (subunit L)/multisubunit Na+/H+ antiporter MnhA subunit
MTFIADSKSSQSHYLHAHESPIPMSLPLVVLAIGSIFIGYLFKDAIIGIGSDFMSESIFVRPVMVDNMIDAEHVSLLIK